MISAIELKSHVASTSILGIIIGKLCQRQKSCLIILLKENKGSKIGFHRTILPLNLAVRLRMEDGEEFLLDA